MIAGRENPPAIRKKMTGHVWPMLRPGMRLKARNSAPRPINTTATTVVLRSVDCMLSLLKDGMACTEKRRPHHSRFARRRHVPIDGFSSVVWPRGMDPASKRYNRGCGEIESWCLRVLVGCESRERTD